MDKLTNEHKHFLMDQVRTAKLAIVRKDGRPHVTPVWFELMATHWSLLHGIHP